MSFDDKDLADLKYFLDTAADVCPYSDVANGHAEPGSIALRHDVDHSLEKAAHFAQWEYDNKYTSTYFILHSAPYWKESNFSELVQEIASYGHEIGLHNDALCEADGDIGLASSLIAMYIEKLQNAVSEDYEVVGIADHGGSPHTNGDIWQHFSPESFGLQYEAYQLQKSTNTYISDNQGTWRSPLKHAQTFMLVHPTWWPV